MPSFIEPSLATLHGKPPTGDQWLHEIKYDGYRLQLHLSEGRAKLFTRRGHDWTSRFDTVAATAWGLKAYKAVLDGEVIVPAENGRSDFHALERDLGAGRSDRFAYYAFDLLYLDGFDLRGAALVDRKAVLAELLQDAPAPIFYSEHLETDGPAILVQACRLGLEGIVSKRRDSRYRSGRSSDWFKATCRHRETFVVAGWAEKAGGKFDGVYLGRHEGGELVYVGKLEVGFSDDDKKRLLERLQPLRTRKQPIKATRSFAKARWVRPLVLIDAEFRGVTGDGLLRHPSYKGMREDLIEELVRGPRASIARRRSLGAQR